MGSCFLSLLVCPLLLVLCIIPLPIPCMLNMIRNWAFPQLCLCVCVYVLQYDVYFICHFQDRSFQLQPWTFFHLLPDWLSSTFRVYVCECVCTYVAEWMLIMGCNSAVTTKLVIIHFVKANEFTPNEISALI